MTKQRTLAGVGDLAEQSPPPHPLQRVLIGLLLGALLGLVVALLQPRRPPGEDEG